MLSVKRGKKVAEELVIGVSAGGGGGRGTLYYAYMGRLHPKGVSFSGFGYIKGLEFHKLGYIKG